jgi:cephalosporin hydroxylase
MSFGERAALEGLLCQLRPRLAIEIGTAEGGSLARLAEHSDEVHSFDLILPSEQLRELSNVTLHTGDGHELLPKLLSRLSDAGRSVDFALVDGDHSAEGVRRDVEDLLDSPAVGNTVIVVHDTMNETVRAGLEQVRYDGYPKVAYVDLDFVAGHLSVDGPYAGQLWGGLGLIVVDPEARATRPGIRDDTFHPAGELLRLARDLAE